MQFSILSLGLMATSTLAAKDVVSMFIPDSDGMSYNGKVIGINGTTTSYELACADASATTSAPSATASCNMEENGHPTIISAPYSIHVMDPPGQVKNIVDCQLHGKNATCTGTLTAYEGGSMMNTFTVPITSNRVTVTATDVSTTIASTKATATATGASATADATSDSASASATPTVTDNAAMAQMTGNAHLLAGGAAIAMAFAMV
ncbi:hypothetical protein AWENTII_011938 [Aspergillus wentii]|nr:hypothetical protein MW887_005727 [Aspergillus wentii]